MNQNKTQQLIESAIADLQQSNFAAGDAKLMQILSMNTETPDIVAVQVFIKSKIIQQQFRLIDDWLALLLSQAPQHISFLFYVVENSLQHKAFYLVKRICSHLADNSSNATVLVTCARFFRLISEFDYAITCYQTALASGYDNKADLYVAMSTVYSAMQQHDRVEACLENALKCHPEHETAMFNLATHLEEKGQLKQAKQLYEKLSLMRPELTLVLSRLMYMEKMTAEHTHLLNAATKLLGTVSSELDKETLYYALGKAYDDLADYPRAFCYYQKGNELNKRRLPVYDHRTQVSLVDRIIKRSSQFSPLNVEPSKTCHIFICGMFRSGTTLVEQILAYEKNLYAAGELTFVDQLLAEYFPDYPECDVTAEKLIAFRESYEWKVYQLAPDARYVTNKMPDNFLYLDILAAAFPDAKFIFTDRHPLDISLSTYFQQLGSRLSYSCSILEILQFYTEFQRLKTCWLNVISDNCFVFHYDSFIATPERVSFDLYQFCQLHWTTECLDFHKLDNVVKTASIWQVRQPIFNSSSGRYRNYEQPLRKVLEGTVFTGYL